MKEKKTHSKKAPHTAKKKKGKSQHKFIIFHYFDSLKPTSAKSVKDTQKKGSDKSKATRKIKMGIFIFLAFFISILLIIGIFRYSETYLFKDLFLLLPYSEGIENPHITFYLRRYLHSDFEHLFKQLKSSRSLYSKIDFFERYGEILTKNRLNENLLFTVETNNFESFDFILVAKREKTHYYLSNLQAHFPEYEIETTRSIQYGRPIKMRKKQNTEDSYNDIFYLYLFEKTVMLSTREFQSIQHRLPLAKKASLLEKLSFEDSLSYALTFIYPRHFQEKYRALIEENPKKFNTSIVSEPIILRNKKRSDIFSFLHDSLYTNKEKNSKENGEHARTIFNTVPKDTIFLYYTENKNDMPVFMSFIESLFLFSDFFINRRSDETNSPKLLAKYKKENTISSFEIFEFANETKLAESYEYFKLSISEYLSSEKTIEKEILLPDRSSFIELIPKEDIERTKKTLSGITIETFSHANKNEDDVVLNNDGLSEENEKKESNGFNGENSNTSISLAKIGMLIAITDNEETIEDIVLSSLGENRFVDSSDFISLDDNPETFLYINNEKLPNSMFYFMISQDGRMKIVL